MSDEQVCRRLKRIARETSVNRGTVGLRGCGAFWPRIFS